MSDAELMEKYLIEDLGVPSDHIQRLLGSTGGGNHRWFYKSYSRQYPQDTLRPH